MTSFKDFGLNTDIQKAISDLGFETPTEIQEKAIPFLLQNKQDLVALAQTGTGKTAAFGLPLLNQIDVNNNDVQAIILCPTRELCMQLAKDIEKYSKYQKDMRVISVYGGTDISQQIKQLRRGAHIVVGTPGRTLDLIKRRKLILSSIEYIVFDEADEMLSMGFKDDMDKILEVTPEEKQVLLFSATMPREIAKMAKNYMDNPHEIAIGHKNTGNANVEHHYYEVNGRRKYEVLKRIADINPDIYGIVFCRTRAETKEIAAQLGVDGYNSDAIHGDLSQSQRDNVMKRFRSKQIQLLVATDVAARGIDVQDLTHIINFSLPDELATYTHRSGRTGRAGSKGISIILAGGRDKRKLTEIERKIKLPIEKQQIPSGEAVCKVQLMNLVDRLEKVEINPEVLDEHLPEIYAKLEELDKETLIQKLISLEFNKFLAYYKNSEDLNTRSKRDRDSGGRDRDRGGRDRDRGGRDRDRGGRDRDRGGRDRDRGRERNSGRDRDSDREGRDRGERSEGRRESSRDRDSDRGSQMRYSRFYINLGEKNDINAKGLLGVINKYTPEHSIEIGKIEILKGFSFFEVQEELAHVIPKALNNERFSGTSIIVKPVSSGEGKKEKKSYGKDRDRDRGGKRDDSRGGDKSKSKKNKYKNADKDKSYSKK